VPDPRLDDGRARLLEHAAARKFPRLKVGRLVIREGELSWRQATTLAAGPELLRLAAALALATGAAGRPGEVS
jgi:hypothetical protein